MSLPGFTAELSLMQKGNYYERYTARSIATGKIQPALTIIIRLRCVCIKEIPDPIGGYQCIQQLCLPEPVVINSLSL